MDACRNVSLAGSSALGVNGQSVYGYQAYAMDAVGTGFSLTYTGVETYRAILLSPIVIPTPVLGNFTGLFQKWTGDDGIPGAISREWKFSNNTAASDPTAGFVKLNNSDATLVTAIYISETDNDVVLVSAMLALAGLSASVIKSYVQVTKKNDSSKFALYSVGSLTDNGNWDTLAVTYVSGSGTGPFALNDEVIFSISLPGPAGAAASVVLFNNLTSPSSGDTGGATFTFLTESIPGGTFANDGDSVCGRVALVNKGTPPTAFYAKAKINGIDLIGLDYFVTSNQSCIIDFCIDRVDATHYQITSTIIASTNNVSVLVSDLGVWNWANPITVDVQANTTATAGNYVVCTKLFAIYNPI